jgi:hypothetical protein
VTVGEGHSESLVQRLGNGWAAHFLACELVLCWLGTAFLIALSEVLLGPRHLNAYLGANRYTAFAAMVGVYGVLLGLVIAAGALVLDRLAEGRLRLVQQSRHIHALPAIFRSAMASLGIATVLSAIALIPTRSAVANRVVVYAWVLFTLLVIARLARVIWIVGKLMDIVATQEAS